MSDVGKEEVMYDCPKNHGPFTDSDKWAFRSKAWQECYFKSVNLGSVYRQNDAAFINILQKPRLGLSWTAAERQLLLNHECYVEDATSLFPTVNEVAAVNEREFNKLDTPIYEQPALDYCRGHGPHADIYKARNHEDGTLVALEQTSF
jgi:ATP-dependent DNA helicase PIF1